MLTANDVRLRLAYDPETGRFTRRVPGARRWKVGDLVGCRNSAGYLATEINGKNFFLHRLAWLYVHGEWPKFDIDHINGIKDDNRIANLRDVSKSVNLQNQRRPHAGSSSGYLGVSRSGAKFVASIRCVGKLKSLGTYETAAEASEVYQLAKLMLHEGRPA
jgi:hypothetical protein